MKAYARKTKPTPVVLLAWSDNEAAKIYPPVHEAVLCEAETGEFRATVEVDCNWVPIRSTVGCGYRWRVFVSGSLAAVGCAGSIEYCQKRAEQFVRDWPKYPPNAQAALLANEEGKAGPQ